MSHRAPLLFNPSRASFEELEQTFVGRWPQLEALEQSLLADASGRSTRHWQLIGPRGSGKSHFTELLSRRLVQQHGWAVVRLPEEHYQIANIAELLEQIVIRLEELTTSPFAEDGDVIRVEELALDRLRAWKRKHQRPLLVILENLGMLLERQIPGRRDQSRLREILMREPPFVLLATATSYADATVQHSAPFYDFFQNQTLEDLKRQEVLQLVEARARWDQDGHLLGQMGQVRPRVDAIFHFSGGNPRLVLALYGVLRHGVTEELYTQLLKLLDEVTPYYQARLNDVSPQMVRVLTELALADGALTPSTLATRLRMTTSQVTANVTKLQSERFIHPGGRPDLKRRYYELSDRLFRIWMQMREGSAGRQKLRFLTEFFQRWYDNHPEDLENDAARVATAFWKELLREHPGRCSDLLTTLDYLESTFPDNQGNLMLREINDAYYSENFTEHKDMIPRLERLRNAVEDPSQKMSVSHALALIYQETGHPKKIIDVLKPLTTTEQRSHHLTWLLYLTALREENGTRAAYTSGVHALQKNPNLANIKDRLACWAVELGEAEKAEQLFNEYLTYISCSHCRHQSFVEYMLCLLQNGEVNVARKAHVRALKLLDKDPELNFLGLCIARAEGKNITIDDMHATLGSWPNLESVPLWILETTACSLSHGRAPEKAFEIFKIVSARAQQRLKRQPGFIKHMLEILVRLRAVGSILFNDAESWLASLNLEPVAVAREFTALMPRLARAEELRPHVIGIYRSLTKFGIITDKLLPYSAAVEAQDASEPDKFLMALSPELREAVSLLLAREDKQSSGLPPMNAKEPPLQAPLGSSAGRKPARASRTRSRTRST